MTSLLHVLAALTNATPCGAEKPDCNEAPSAPPRPCDICMEMVAAADCVVDLCSDAIAGTDGADEGGSGSERHACPGCLCKGCAKQYVEHIVKDGYDGACPQVKCPACPGRIIPSSKWNPVVDEATKHSIGDRAMKLLSLQCSSCHSRKSLMIGHNPDNLAHTGDEAWRAAATKAEEQLKTAFGANYKEFVRVREQYLRGATKEGTFLAKLTPLYKSRDPKTVDPSTVADPVIKGSPDGPCDLVLQVITSILDPERRATFHVAYLRKFPECYTRCHKARHCFRCHINGFHDGQTCAEYQMSKTTVEDIVPCPQCGLQLTKGDGCSSVNCVCGKNFDWDTELRKVKAALAKLFEETMQHEAEEAALAKYQREYELALEEANNAADNGLGASGEPVSVNEEETKEEHGAAEAKEADDDATTATTKKDYEPALRGLRTRDEMCRSQWKGLEEPVEPTAAPPLKKLPPKPKPDQPLADKLSIENLADRAALMVYNEGSDEVHVRALAWAKIYAVPHVMKARSRMWAKRYPECFRAAAASYTLSLKLPSTDREVVVAAGWKADNSKSMQQFNDQQRAAHSMAWNAMYPESASMETREQGDHISPADRARLRHAERSSSKRCDNIEYNKKAFKEYKLRMSESEHLRKAEHANAWDYMHQKPAGVVNGTSSSMLDGIDWPANAALTIKELGSDANVKQALGGETRQTLYSNWMAVHTSPGSEDGLASRLKLATAERWVRLTSPALLAAVKADLAKASTQGKGEGEGSSRRVEEGAKTIERTSDEANVDVIVLTPESPRVLKEQNTDTKRQRDKKTAFCHTGSLGASDDMQVATNKSEGRRKRSHSLRYRSSTRGVSNSKPNSSSSWYKNRLSKLKKKSDEEETITSLAKHTAHLGGPLPFALVGKGPFEAAVDLEVACKAKRISKSAFLERPTHTEYYSTWKRGGWRSEDGTVVSEKQIEERLEQIKAMRWEKENGDDAFDHAVAFQLDEVSVSDGSGSQDQANASGKEHMSREMKHYLASWTKLNEKKIEEWKASQWEDNGASHSGDAAAAAVDAQIHQQMTKTIDYSMGTFSSNFNGHEVQLWGVSDAQRESLPKLEGPYSKCVLKLGWCDQGWGNQKGHLHARVDGGKWRRLTKQVAPHHMTNLEIEVPLELCGRSGLLEFGYEVGGGGGHALNISNARVTAIRHVDGGQILDKRLKAYLTSWKNVPGNFERMEAVRADRWVELHSDGVGGGEGVSSLSAEAPPATASLPFVEEASTRAVEAALDIEEGKVELDEDSGEYGYYCAWMKRATNTERISSARAARAAERAETWSTAFADSGAAAEAATSILERSKERGAGQHDATWFKRFNRYKLDGFDTEEMGASLLHTLQSAWKPTRSSTVHYRPNERPAHTTSKKKKRVSFGSKADDVGAKLREAKAAEEHGSAEVDARTREQQVLEWLYQAKAWAEANQDSMELVRLRRAWRANNSNGQDGPATLEELRTWWDKLVADSMYKCSCGQVFSSAGAFYSHCGLTGHVPSKKG